MGKNVVIGCDPDSKAHGVAVYMDGRLIELRSFELLELQQYIEQDCCGSNSIELHIENVCGVSAAFNARDRKTNLNVKLKIAQHIGMCKQAQVEVERMAEANGVKVVKHKISKMWKKDKAQFEKVTGWSGHSNEDTRSASWFGYLGCK